ncbi:serine/threonine protein kinase, partial [Salmonella enterica]|nr:serine/threonine protein kinase [Salmonella enterica]
MRTEALESSDGGSLLPEGAQIGPYRLIQQLGEGGMGVVHLALAPNGRAVALKLLRPH